MASDGKDLEELVSTIERLFLPGGCTVESRKIERTEAGTQLAEMDITVTGKLGTTEILWLIECRDRPSEGAAPTAWIEQLAGRKDLYKFNQVTAVSTTGFSAGATELAKRAGIEIRTLEDVTPEEILTWHTVQKVVVHSRNGDIKVVILYPFKDEKPELIKALAELLAKGEHTSDGLMLKSTTTGNQVNVGTVFTRYLDAHPEAGSGVSVADPEGKTVRFKIVYAADDCFTIETSAGPVRVRGMEFEAVLRMHEVELTPGAQKSYRRDVKGDLIAQSVIYPAKEIEGRGEVQFELHKKADSDEMFAVVRQRDGKDKK